MKVSHKIFGDGRIVNDTTLTTNDLEPGVNYSYKVTAVNSGGESFPSEILSICWKDSTKGTVLIINGFNRICGPAVVQQKNYKGFANYRDEGVPYKYSIGFTGAQFNYKPGSFFRNNDSPGWGDSHSNYETEIIAGNTFDYPLGYYCLPG